MPVCTRRPLLCHRRTFWLGINVTVGESLIISFIFIRSFSLITICYHIMEISPAAKSPTCRHQSLPSIFLIGFTRYLSNSKQVQSEFSALYGFNSDAACKCCTHNLSWTHGIDGKVVVIGRPIPYN